MAENQAHQKIPISEKIDGRKITKFGQKAAGKRPENIIAIICM
jgi:hypothetical protein